MLFTEYELWPQDELDIFTLTQVPEFITKGAVCDGLKYHHQKWTHLSADMFTDCVGNTYTEEWEKRRIALASLAMAEHTERKGRFIPDIINGIWAICEETTWSLPDGSGYLKDIEAPKFDTATAKTAQLLATCYNLFLRELPLAVKKRIAYEVRRRCTLTFLEAKNFTPENTAAAFISCIFTEENEEKRRMICDKVLELTDEFLTKFSSDGFKTKNEHNLYAWSMYIFDILEMLYSATDNKLGVFESDKIMPVAKALYQSYLGSDGFSEKSTESGGSRIYLFGKRMDFKKLMDFGASEFLKTEDKLLSESYNLFHKLYSLKHASEILAYGDNFDAEESGYIDSMDIFIKKTKCFSVAVKGGSQSAGNLMVYLENEPYLVDLEKSHNLPIINGFTQFANTKRAYCTKLDNGLEVDITETYPKDAGIVKWVRKVEAEEKYVIITEDFELSKNEDIRLVMLMKNKPILSGDRIILGDGQIIWDGNMNLRVELVKSKTYGYVYRLIFHVKTEENKGIVRLAIKM